MGKTKQEDDDTHCPCVHQSVKVARVALLLPFQIHTPQYIKPHYGCALGEQFLWVTRIFYPLYCVTILFIFSVFRKDYYVWHLSKDLPSILSSWASSVSSSSAETLAFTSPCTDPPLDPCLGPMPVTLVNFQLVGALIVDMFIWLIPERHILKEVCNRFFYSFAFFSKSWCVLKRATEASGRGQFKACGSVSLMPLKRENIQYIENSLINMSLWLYTTFYQWYILQKRLKVMFMLKKCAHITF